MEPMTMLAIAAAAAGGWGAAKSGKENRKASERQTQMSSKEQKRATLADLLSRAMDRRYNASKDARLTQSDLAQKRQEALMQMVAGFRDAYK
jgi:flagellar hook-basal body complex protein FliE